MSLFIFCWDGDAQLSQLLRLPHRQNLACGDNESDEGEGARDNWDDAECGECQRHPIEAAARLSLLLLLSLGAENVISWVVRVYQTHQVIFRIARGPHSSQLSPEKIMCISSWRCFIFS